MAELMLVAVIFLLATTVQEAKAQDECVQNGLLDYRAVPGSCTQYQMCSFGQLTNFTCSDGTVFNQHSSACVPRGSELDLCAITPRDLPLPVCQPGSTNKMADPRHCARYFDCSKQRMRFYWNDHEQECEYPNLYNEDTQMCEHYSRVNCADREEPLDPCEYKVQSCNVPSSHCIPCWVWFPSCRGMPDGMNEWRGKRNSPFYVECRNQRIVQSGRCQYPTNIFDWRLKRCVSPPF